MGFSVRQAPLQGRTAHTKCGMYLLGPSLAAALLDDLFEHPASNSTSGLRYTRHRTLGLPQYLVPQAISQIIR